MMTEGEWLRQDEPEQLLIFHGSKLSQRKLQLWLVACCRKTWHLFKDPRSQRAVETTEEFADNPALERELEEAQLAAQAVWDREDDEDNDNGAWAADILARGEFVGDAWAWTGEKWASAVAGTVCEFDAEGPTQSSLSYQAKLLRDVAGNPFRPMANAEAWRSPTTLSIAEGIYTERAFDRLPILADALEDAGCTSRDILDHCRGPGPHVRGCWVVDLVLGKR